MKIKHIAAFACILLAITFLLPLSITADDIPGNNGSPVLSYEVLLEQQPNLKEVVENESISSYLKEIYKNSLYADWVFRSDEEERYSNFTPQLFTAYSEILSDKNIDRSIRTQYLFALDENRLLSADEIISLEEKARWDRENPPAVNEDGIKLLTATKDEVYADYYETAKNSPHLSDMSRKKLIQALDENRVAYFIASDGEMYCFYIVNNRFFDNRAYNSYMELFEDDGKDIIVSYLAGFVPEGEVEFKPEYMDGYEMD